MSRWIWKQVAEGAVARDGDYGCAAGDFIVLQELTKARRTLSRGWRRHVRKQKAAKR